MQILVERERWMGIDPGLAKIGWAILEDDESSNVPSLLDFGSIETCSKKSTAQRLLEIEQDISELLKEYQPDNIALEIPFFGRQIKAAGKVLQAVSVITLVCYRELEIVPIQLHQASWKCQLGNGRANKSEVAEILRPLV